MYVCKYSSVFKSVSHSQVNFDVVISNAHMAAPISFVKCAPNNLHNCYTRLVQRSGDNSSNWHSKFTDSTLQRRQKTHQGIVRYIFVKARGEKYSREVQFHYSLKGTGDGMKSTGQLCVNIGQLPYFSISTGTLRPV